MVGKAGYETVFVRMDCLPKDLWDKYTACLGVHRATEPLKYWAVASHIFQDDQKVLTVCDPDSGHFVEVRCS